MKMTTKHGAIAAGVLLGLLALFLMFKPKAAPYFMLKPTPYAQLPGWQKDNLKTGLKAFLISCEAQIKRPKTTQLGILGYAGTIADWIPVCEAGKKIDPEDSAEIRAFFEQNLTPVAITSLGSPLGKFTGYYEAMVRGSFTKHDEYDVPIYTLPDDLINVNLGLFNPEWKGRNITGRVENGKLIPYYTRQQINEGELKSRGLEAMWVDSKIDRFFLEIQGSGRAVLDNGQVVRLLYAGKNGARYRTIGKVLLDKGYLSRKDVSMQAIRKWLKSNPDKAQQILNTNPSFVFFKVSEKTDIYGAENVALTPGRSLAVDKTYVPLGLPVWLDTQIPTLDNKNKTAPFQRLMIAQDTGGVIKTPIRGDIFWGFGGQAEFLAGHMNQEGRYWVFLPSTVVARGLPDTSELEG